MNKLPAKVEQALARLEPAIRDAFLAAVDRIRSAAQLQTVIDHLTNGNIEYALQALSLDPAFFGPLDRAMSEAYWQGGVLALAGMPKSLDPLAFGAAIIAFDGRAPRAEAWVKERSSGLIVEILRDQRAGIRQYLTDGLASGRHPRTIALDLVGRIDRTTGRRAGGIVGLTSQAMGYVKNAREQLSSADPVELQAYLTRVRRDKRFDRYVMQAIRTGKPIPADIVARMTSRYSDRLLQLRGETIARTEAITALGASQHEAYQQMVDRGVLAEEQITRVWQSTGDRRTRHDHVVLNGQTQKGLNTPFETESGVKMLFPRDTSVPGQDRKALAAETINCRCIEKVVIDYLGKKNENHDSNPRGVPRTRRRPDAPSSAGIYAGHRA